VGYIFMIVVGAVFGWLAAFVLRAQSDQDLRRYVGAGVVGAMLTGLVLAPLFTQGNLAAGTYTVDALLMTMAGALAALFAAHMLHQRELI